MPAKPARVRKVAAPRGTAAAKPIKAKRARAGGTKTATPRRSPPTVSDIGPLKGHLGYFIRRLQIWVFQDFIRTLAAIDISPAQFSVLAVIHANEGLSQAELGNTLAIERARLVRLLNRLERRDLLERRQANGDGRRHALRLTPAGQTTFRQAKMLAERHEAGLLAKLGQARYRALMDALRI